MDVSLGFNVVILVGLIDRLQGTHQVGVVRYIYYDRIRLSVGFTLPLPSVEVK